MDSGSCSSKSVKDDLSNKTVQDLGLNEWLVNQCKALNMTKPTPIQYHCIPQILKGHDCVGCAKTGSGKTAAFALPILQTLCEDPYGIFALVLSPTRELAHQIAEQFRVLGKPIGLKELVITGGRDMVEEGKALADKPHIVIATPGRLADHIDTGTNFSLKKIRFLVLDEADRLLDDLEYNFGEQLRTIFAAVPTKRQTLLFSATLTEKLKEVSQQAEKKPFFWASQDSVLTVETLDQRYVLMPAAVKDAYLVHIINDYLEKNPGSSMMIFTNTCKYCQVLGMVFAEIGIECVALHSMIAQRLRLAALNKFKSSRVKIMIATDVGSRGLDIPMVDLIINHNVPTRPKDYVHRVGRTARAGRSGMAITLLTPFDINHFHAIEAHIGTKLTELKVNEDAVAKIATEVTVAKREAEIRLDEQDFEEKREINRQKRMILEGKDPDEHPREKKLKTKHSSKKKTEKQLQKSDV
jgi:ATP-dependent RNA helicase DDX49/DBP8